VKADDHLADLKIQQGGRAAHPDDALRLGAHPLDRLLRRVGFDQHGDAMAVVLSSELRDGGGDARLEPASRIATLPRRTVN
jgi:hypothetical protein